MISIADSYKENTEMIGSLAPDFARELIIKFAATTKSLDSLIK